MTAFEYVFLAHVQKPELCAAEMSIAATLAQEVLGGLLDVEVGGLVVDLVVGGLDVVLEGFATQH